MLIVIYYYQFCFGLLVISIPCFKYSLFQFPVSYGNYFKIYMETESTTPIKLNKQAFKAGSKTLPFPVGGLKQQSPNIRKPETSPRLKHCLPYRSTLLTSLMHELNSRQIQHPIYTHCRSQSNAIYTRIPYIRIADPSQMPYIHSIFLAVPVEDGWAIYTVQIRSRQLIM